jgi:hypothetical protein
MLCPHIFGKAFFQRANLRSHDILSVIENDSNPVFEGPSDPPLLDVEINETHRIILSFLNDLGGRL